jgi:hypothetical protein
MGTKRKSSGIGAILPRALGGGSVASAPIDRATGASTSQAGAIPEGNSREVCELLDGECIRTRFGYDIATPKQPSAPPPRKVKAHLGPTGQLSRVCKRGSESGLRVHPGCWNQGCVCPCHSAK